MKTGGVYQSRANAVRDRRTPTPLGEDSAAYQICREYILTL